MPRMFLISCGEATTPSTPELSASRTSRSTDSSGLLSYANLREYRRVDTGEDTDCEHSRAHACAFSDFGDGLDCPLHHLASAARMNRE